MIKIDNQIHRPVSGRIFLLLCTGLFLFTIVSCWSSGDDKNNDNGETWTLSMRYHYHYYPNGSDVGLLEREEDDNNADSIVDEYWIYRYENDPDELGKRRISSYDHYTGSYPGGVRDAEGIYTYDDGGKLIKLEHITLQGDAKGRWEYTYNSTGLRTGYTYFYNDVQSETGIYIYNSNDHAIELRTTNGTWQYDVDSSGVKLSYDFYLNNVVVREGEYIYDISGRLIQLDSYELM